MARSTSVSLGDHFTEFVQQQVESGRYATASDVLRAGLRLLEREEEHLNWMRSQIAEGLAAIEAGDVYEDSDELWEEIDRGVEERMRRRERSGTHVLP